MLTKIHGVLFDLDGTLLDTAPDLAAALNATLLSQHNKPLPLTIIRPVISEGVAGLLKLGFNITNENVAFPNLYKQLIAYYSQYICEYTQLFPDVDTLIHYLQKNHLPWGIVTNKTMALATKLIDHFPLLKKATCIIAGDTLEYSKPHPKPLLHACECIQCIPKNCLYVGDAKQDIKAANAAGMPSAVALYGYIGNQEDPATWEASTMISTPLSLIDCLKQDA
jgi:N-acetyl-D-muramate 6-phosphate phosphatase